MSWASFKRRHTVLASLLSIVAFGVYLGYANGSFGSMVREPSTPSIPLAVPVPVQATSTTSTVETNAIVVRAVDGDTLSVKLDGETDTATVRLLGINTPETVDPRKPVECFGKEASAHMHALVDGKRVRLDPDPQADERDKYNRLLRNVVLVDGTDVNAEEVKDGYAYASLSFPLNAQRKQQLKNLEDDARMAQRGLWSPSACNGQK